jgi:hypothetical protein
VAECGVHVFEPVGADQPARKNVRVQIRGYQAAFVTKIAD